MISQGQYYFYGYYTKDTFNKKKNSLFLHTFYIMIFIVRIVHSIHLYNVHLKAFTVPPFVYTSSLNNYKYTNITFKKGDFSNCTT